MIIEGGQKAVNSSFGGMKGGKHITIKNYSIAVQVAEMLAAHDWYPGTDSLQAEWDGKQHLTSDYLVFSAAFPSSYGPFPHSCYVLIWYFLLLRLCRTGTQNSYQW